MIDSIYKYFLCKFVDHYYILPEDINNDISVLFIDETPKTVKNIIKLINAIKYGEIFIAAL